MNCKVIQDLLILYNDGFCSDESRALVETHLQTCEACRRELAEMRALPLAADTEPAAPAKPLRRIYDWKASALQSVLLFCAFALVTVGVTMEARTPEGVQNGLWAIAVIVPATGFLLSLANWYFVRLYPSRRAFSFGSLVTFLLLAGCGYLWAIAHYPAGTFRNLAGSPLLAAALLLPACLAALSFLLSGRYAGLLGKD